MDIQIHIESKIKSYSSYINGANSWKIEDKNISDLAKELMDLLGIPTETNKALRLKINQLEQKVKFLEFMVENGLGEDDLKNDITLPKER